VARVTSGWLIASVSQLRKLIVPLTPLPAPLPEALLLLPLEQAATSDDDPAAARAAPAAPQDRKRRRDTPASPAALGTGLRLEAGWLFMTVTP
jgi:hypothetical protein